MTNTPGARLKTAREASGYESAKEAALSMGVPIATYTQHEKAGTHLPARRAAQYASFFGVTPEYLLYGRGVIPARVPVEDNRGVFTGKTAAMPAAPSELTRALIASDGDGIAYRGMVAIYNEPQGYRTPAEFDGKLCVVAVVIDGVEHRIIRVAQKAANPGCFHLIGAGLPLIDHKAVWLAPVLALVPA